MIQSLERFSRNKDVINNFEQNVLAGSKLLVAGCGSVGGSIVEPIVRMGIGALKLIDPEKYDISNLNRQACFYDDIGHYKAEILAKRALSINPDISISIENEGLTLNNIQELINDNVNIIFDGIDVGAAPREKYELHNLASKLRIPVLVGIDFGGKAVIYVFDYRREGAKPFYGRTTKEAHYKGDFVNCLSWIKFRSYPTDFLPIISERLLSKKPWPQVSYCVQAMGALSSRAVLNLLTYKKTPHIIKIDVHQATNTIFQNLISFLKYPIALLNAYLVSKKIIGGNLANQEEDIFSKKTLVHFSNDIEIVLKAMSRAPSPHNIQPWKMQVQDEKTILLFWNTKCYLDVVDPNAHGMAIAIGCAIQCAKTVAELDIEYSQDIESTFIQGGLIAKIYIREVKITGSFYNMGVIINRTTNRGEYINTAYAKNIIKEITKMSSGKNYQAKFIGSSNKKLMTTSSDGAKKLFSKDVYIKELLNHFKLQKEDISHSSAGMLPIHMNVSKFDYINLKIMKWSPVFRKIINLSGIWRLMAYKSIKEMKNSQNFILISSKDKGALGKINSGILLMKIWIELNQKNLAVQLMDFPISYELGRKEISEMFNLNSKFEPVILIRVGWPKKKINKPTNRYKIIDLVELN